MAILLSLFTVIKYVCSLIFKGPLNFNIEILFWVFNGMLFGPIKGSLFSILCDTVFTLISGIAYWMIEYAIVAPLVTILSWFMWKLYKENNKWTIYFSISIILVMLITTLVIFFIQLVNKKFEYEQVKTINPIFVYSVISFLSISAVSFVLFCLIAYKKTNKWMYINWLYIFTLIIVIVILFRWLWGPFAFYMYKKRFISANIDFEKSYVLSLFGIVMKSCLTIPLATLISIPLFPLFSKLNSKYSQQNKF